MPNSLTQTIKPSPHNPNLCSQSHHPQSTTMNTPYLFSAYPVINNTVPIQNTNSPPHLSREFPHHSPCNQTFPIQNPNHHFTTHGLNLHHHVISTVPSPKHPSTNLITKNPFLPWPAFNSMHLQLTIATSASSQTCKLQQIQSHQNRS